VFHDLRDQRDRPVGDQTLHAAPFERLVLEQIADGQQQDTDRDETRPAAEMPQAIPCPFEPENVEGPRELL
jgi:hypothetical protein